MRGDDDDALVAVVQRFRIREPHVDCRRPLQRVDPRVAGDEDLSDGDVLADEVLEVRRSGSEVEPGDARDELAIADLGERRPVAASVRSPASTCMTGMWRWKAASAAAIADVVSPCTSTAAGARPVTMSSGSGGTSGSISKRSEQKSSNRRMTDATRSLSCERRDHSPEDDVRCDPGELEDVVDEPVVLAGRHDERLVVVALVQPPDDRNELIASGRVPTTIGTTSFRGPGRTATASSTVTGALQQLTPRRATGDTDVRMNGGCHRV